MKKVTLLMSLMMCMSLLSVAQEVPTKISEAFKAKFPKAESSSWEMNNKMEWESDFTMNGLEHSVTYSKTGERLKSESQIMTSDLPASITDQLKNDFADFEVVDVEQVESSAGERFEIELNDGDQQIEVHFDSAGKMIAKNIEMESEEDEMEDE